MNIKNVKVCSHYIFEVLTGELALILKRKIKWKGIVINLQETEVLQWEMTRDKWKFHKPSINVLASPALRAEGSAGLYPSCLEAKVGLNPGQFSTSLQFSHKSTIVPSRKPHLKHTKHQSLSVCLRKYNRTVPSLPLAPITILATGWRW